METPLKLPRTTWVPGVGERPDDAWLKEIAPDMLVHVGILLFERGQGFEAHEAWELAWREVKKQPARADEERMLRALIKLAAAMVKVRQQVERGVRDHAHGAGDLLDALDHDVYGIALESMRAMARRVESDPLPDPALPVGMPMFGKITRTL